MPRGHTNMEKIRAELAWVNETLTQTARCIEINAEIDGRAGRLADIVMRITIGSSASSDSFEF